ncbi:54S ribosomal protein L4 mitochondrial [Coemansia sp. RSA 1972]|nr:54S ribosomal protein L4 mitochondrial [Coemansia sp. RSA 1972]
MFGRFGAITRSLSSRRTLQSSFVGRGLEEFFEAGQRLPVEKMSTGRSWSASELRQKSWEDLQKLWYIVLKERNVLASQKVEKNRLGVPTIYFANRSRAVKCQQTMARIKTVLNERNIAWAKAQEEQKKSKGKKTLTAPMEATEATPAE